MSAAEPRKSLGFAQLTALRLQISLMLIKENGRCVAGADCGATLKSLAPLLIRVTADPDSELNQNRSLPGEEVKKVDSVFNVGEKKC